MICLSNKTKILDRIKVTVHVFTIIYTYCTDYVITHRRDVYKKKMVAF